MAFTQQNSKLFSVGTGSSVSFHINFDAISEFQNRKIFEDLQQEKKILLKQGVPPLNTALPTAALPPNRVSRNSAKALCYVNLNN